MGKFTIQSNGRWCKIITPCKVSAIKKRNVVDDPKYIECDSAQWDTGSMVTLISQRIVRELNLKHTGYTTLTGLENKPIKAKTYMVDIEFPEGTKVPFREVAEAPLVVVDLLIGMDIIGEGDFLYSGITGKSSFTFAN